MRSRVLRNRRNALLRVASIGVMGVAIAGCSSGFERFDHYYNSATPQAANTTNSYPGAVDPTTTASTRGRLSPLGNVAPTPVPQGVYHQAEPTFAQPANAQPTYSQPTYQAPQAYQPYTAQPQVQAQAPASQPRQYQSLAQYRPTTTTSQASGRSGVVQASPLPPARSAAPVYTPPKPDPVKAKTVYIPPAKPDPVTTAAVSAPAPAPAAPNVSQPRVDQGWTSTGATTITARAGETLYNLSKRYGVPVSEIRKANAMSSAASLQAGQNVVIPNYIYSPTSPISAPDNNPATRAARAGIGYVGEANPARVAVPTHRPYQVAAISPSGQTEDASAQRYQPKTHVEPPSGNNTPDYSITTGSISNPAVGSYVVQAGDSLSKIANRNGISVSQLQAANSLTGSNIQLGQKLVIPDAVTKAATTVAKVKNALPKNVDPVVTGSLNDTSKSQAVAPARTGISDFRWPVSGRVVEAFGADTSSGKNEGIDISVPEGTAVKAAENGVVIYAGSEISTYGNLILIKHADDWVSAYAHNRDFEVRKGDNVRRGQTIARSGRTGDADRPKLHFELRKNSRPVNPTTYLAGS